MLRKLRLKQKNGFRIKKKRVWGDYHRRLFDNSPSKYFNF